ncbi:TNT domain-containing protein [Streptacidiphilus sp. 4-A2]|nr:TNT domain-containing protein [Streptacidiphilus sp. 4-A2]
MRIRRNLAAAFAATALLAATAVTTGASDAQASVPGAAAKALGVESTPMNECSAASYDNDSRLGPLELPTIGRVGDQLLGYRRAGYLRDTADLLAKYWSPTANNGAPGWVYPPEGGYLIGRDGRPIKTTETLVPGSDIDRYGSQYGTYLAPEGLPYSARSLPPSSLNSDPAATCNYHDYKVDKPFRVDAGPIAPWFGQPGHGWQYQLDAALLPGAPAALNVLWLVDNHYLSPVA